MRFFANRPIRNLTAGGFLESESDYEVGLMAMGLIKNRQSSQFKHTLMRLKLEIIFLILLHLTTNKSPCKENEYEIQYDCQTLLTGTEKPAWVQLKFCPRFDPVYAEIGRAHV